MTTGLITGLLGIYPFPTVAEVLVLAALRDPDARVRPLAAAAPADDVDWPPLIRITHADAAILVRRAPLLSPRAAALAAATTAGTRGGERATRPRSSKFELTDDGLHAREAKVAAGR